MFVQFSVFSADTVEQRLAKLEQVVKAQSDSITTYKAKVAEVEKQKAFFSDIFSTNVGFVSIIFSVMATGIFGLTVYNVVDNNAKNKEIKEEFNKFSKDINMIISQTESKNIISMQNIYEELNVAKNKYAVEIVDLKDKYETISNGLFEKVKSIAKSLINNQQDYV